MKIRLLIEHHGTVYDATEILTNSVIWESSVRGEAGKLTFTVVRDGIIHFVEGDKVQLYTDGILRFSGWVMKKERTDAQIISVTAYDQIFYLAKNRGTYVYWDKTAVDVIRMIAGEYGLQTGAMTNTGWVIPQRIEEGETLLDIILSALELSERATGKEFFFFDDGGKLTVKERKEMESKGIFRCDGGVASYTYMTDISKDTCNGVRLYQAGRKEMERLTFQKENGQKVKEWGRLYAYHHVPFELNQAQMQEIADGILREKCRVQKILVVDNVNGDADVRAGQSVYLDIPDLAEVGIEKSVLVEKCTHIYRDGEHRIRMVIRVEE